ncbi:MAG TPA: response regulator [bacterium]|nr:response regulator [bacterium]
MSGPEREKKLRILIVDDNPDDVFLIKQNITEAAAGRFVIETASALKEGLEKAADSDVVLLDLSLPDSSGIATLEKMGKTRPGLPIIVITGLNDEGTAIDAVKTGAQDYIVKDTLDGKLLVKAVQYAVERKKIEAEAAAARAELEVILDSSPNAMFIVDSELTVKKANRTSEKTFGRSRESMTGEFLGNAINCENCGGGAKCGDNKECRRCAIRLFAIDAGAENERYERLEVKKVMKTGGGVEEKYFYFSVVPVTYRGEHSVLVSLEDTTVRKRMEERLEKANEQLIELDAVKSNFLAMVSHELRTPLTSIRGYITLILGGAAGKLNSEQVSFVESVRNNTEKLVLLINDLLDMSKIELGTFSVKKSRQDVSMIVKKTCRDMEAANAHRQVKIRFKSEPEENYAPVDSHRLSQVVANLINNACKHAPDNSEVLVSVSCAEDEAGERPQIGTLITVEDKGTGIEKENLERVFNRFFQVVEEEKRAHKGVGLGLNIAKGIVDAHGGRIWAESEGRGKGAKFSVFLPEE